MAQKHIYVHKMQQTVAYMFGIILSTILSLSNSLYCVLQSALHSKSGRKKKKKEE